MYNNYFYFVIINACGVLLINGGFYFLVATVAERDTAAAARAAQRPPLADPGPLISCCMPINSHNVIKITISVGSRVHMHLQMHVRPIAIMHKISMLLTIIKHYRCKCQTKHISKLSEIIIQCSPLYLDNFKLKLKIHMKNINT